MQSRRVLAAVTVLAVVWIGVYWATPPAPQPVAAITFDDREPQPPVRPAPTPVLAEREPVAATIEPPPPPQPQTTSAPAVIPPAFKERTVRPGDTMETIAKAEFGDSGKWTIVASANPRVDPMKMRPGMTLRIPLDPDNIQGKPNPDLTVREPVDPAAADEPARIEYIVRSGDTLGGIARTYYNSAAKWRVILDANADALTRPEQLRPGMKLVIPPAPAGE